MTIVIFQIILVKHFNKGECAKMYKQDVIKFFGSIRAVAKALDISTQAVHQWHNVIPEAAAYKIEVLTDGKLKAK